MHGPWKRELAIRAWLLTKRQSRGPEEAWAAEEAVAEDMT